LQLRPIHYRQLVSAALREDLGTGDLTTELLIDGNIRARGTFLAKASGVMAGMPVALEVFSQLDPEASATVLVAEGSRFHSGQVLATVTAQARALLSGERVALNFLQRLCGIATATARLVERANPWGVVVLDTRKTTPGLRVLEKYAVRMGGGRNHRFGLYDAVLIKDNHIALAGSVASAVKKVRGRLPHVYRIQVEVRTLQELEEAIHAGADLVLLDNMTPDQLREAVRRAKGRVPLEASGGITVETVEEVARCGVDFISSGYITHSAPAVDISLEMQLDTGR